MSVSVLVHKSCENASALFLSVLVILKLNFNARKKSIYITQRNKYSLMHCTCALKHTCTNACNTQTNAAQMHVIHKQMTHTLIVLTLNVLKAELVFSPY